MFFEELRVWMAAFPPADRDAHYQQRFAPLGLLDSDSPYVEPDADLAAALTDGLRLAKERMEAALKDGSSPKLNGWTLTYHVFDYNLDFFEVGAIDDPKWKLDVEPAQRYLERALSARGGLWGNHGYEAAYAMAYTDGDGSPLDGSQRYEMRLEETPPVGAFWSITMYDTPDFFLVANPINRYSIGDRTPGLQTADGGSLTIRLQHDEPSAPEARANWLPAPRGAFRPILRMYEPGDAVFDGGYKIPPIVRVD